MSRTLTPAARQAAEELLKAGAFTDTQAGYLRAILQEWDAAAIAAELGVSINTVRHATSQVLQMVRSHTPGGQLWPDRPARHLEPEMVEGDSIIDFAREAGVAPEHLQWLFARLSKNGHFADWLAARSLPADGLVDGQPFVRAGRQYKVLLGAKVRLLLYLAEVTDLLPTAVVAKEMGFDKPWRLHDFLRHRRDLRPARYNAWREDERSRLKAALQEDSAGPRNGKEDKGI